MNKLQVSKLSIKTAQKMTNYLKTHKFEGSGESEDSRTELCLCGLPEDNPLHFARVSKMKTKITETAVEELLRRFNNTFCTAVGGSMVLRDTDENQFVTGADVTAVATLWLDEELTALEARVREETAEDICSLLDDNEHRYNQR